MRTSRHPRKAILVTHTHWDREWYFTVEEYRFRLVRMFDTLLDILDTEPDYHSFWLDGHIIPIDDYLAVRPENRDRLEKAIRNGKILVGPWYILADELLVSGEAFIRNLRIGMDRMRTYGQDNTIGYLPDTFGHLSQTPQLLRGFGIDNAVFWRGYSLGDLDKSETTWSSPDGSTVLAICLVQGYSNACGLGEKALQLKSSMEDQKERLEHTLPVIAKMASSDTLLLMNGIDHSIPTRHLADVIRQAARQYGIAIRHGSLRDYLRAVDRRKLGRRCLRGEIPYAPGLDATLSARTWLKVMNRNCENLLAHYIEPLAAWAAARGAPYPDGFIRRAWELVIKNHPHDTICGCHANGVAEDARTRYRRAEEIAVGVIRDSVDRLVGSDTLGATVTVKSRLVVHQPTGWETTAPWEAVIDLPAGTKSRPAWLEPFAGTGRPPLPLQILSKSRTNRRRFHDHVNPTIQDIDRYRVAVAPCALPPMSITQFHVRTGPRAESAQPLVRTSMHSGRAVLENTVLRVTVRPDGSMNLTNLTTGRRLRQLNRLVIEGDAGSLYRFAPRKGERPTAAIPGSMRITQPGPILGEVCVKTALKLRRKRVPVKLWIGLSGMNDFVTIRAEIDNTEKDHRIQALFPLPPGFRRVKAHMPFDMVDREPIPCNETTRARARGRRNCSCQAMQFMVCAGGSDHALTVPARGLCEYTQTRASLLGVTLLRAVGTITPGLASHPAGTGQCPGIQKVEYAVGLAAESEPARLLKRGFEFNLPPQVVQVFDPAAAEPGSLVTVSNPHWILSAVKRSDDGKGLVVRFFSLASRRTSGTVALGVPFRRAERCRIDETPVEPLAGRQGAVRLSARPREIVTVRFGLIPPRRPQFLGSSSGGNCP